MFGPQNTRDKKTQRNRDEAKTSSAFRRLLMISNNATFSTILAAILGFAAGVFTNVISEQISEPKLDIACGARKDYPFKETSATGTISQQYFYVFPVKIRNIGRTATEEPFAVSVVYGHRNGIKDGENFQHLNVVQQIYDEGTANTFGKVDDSQEDIVKHQFYIGELERKQEIELVYVARSNKKNLTFKASLTSIAQQDSPNIEGFEWINGQLLHSCGD